jgi:hypothetical protein
MSNLTMNDEYSLQTTGAVADTLVRDVIKKSSRNHSGHLIK